VLKWCILLNFAEHRFVQQQMRYISQLMYLLLKSYAMYKIDIVSINIHELAGHTVPFTHYLTGWL